MSATTSNAPFEIGLVMAGAISAGAYTAGVIDFLLQALNEWESAIERNEPHVPRHEVRLKVIAGASAGGMTGAIVSAMINGSYSPITVLPGREPTSHEVKHNQLYNAWVRSIDISKLLKTNDLASKNSPVLSILDSTVLENIAKETLSFIPNNQRPRWLSDQLQLYLTLTNLQGIPYDIGFLGNSGKSEYSVDQHGDYMHFTLSHDNPHDKEAVWLKPNDPSHTHWQILKESALATGAFPGGLAPRFIQRPFSNYDYRKWTIAQRPDNFGPHFDCIRQVPIHPAWPEHHSDIYNFVSVDGGVMDNEPFDLAHDCLAGEDGFNPREPDQTHRAILMVDPFPNNKKSALLAASDFKDYDILKVFGKLYGSLIDQARFKPEDLILANSSDIFSRYLIAPSRRNPDDTIAPHPIASGCLGGFGGFLSEKFRIHDFQLGRRNCQLFLRKHFVLPLDKARNNPVFSNYSDSDFDRLSLDENGKRVLPIIPLMGSANDSIQPVIWNAIKMEETNLTILRKQIHFRTKVVINQLLNQYIDHTIPRRMAKAVAFLKRKKLIDYIMTKITEELTTFNLLR
ncbi:MAG TPA: patatin-like phospholipase family protein [Balneolales bacterium]|nr:patatin-like phospholipase family protein [Balneolales bacterium]